MDLSTTKVFAGGTHIAAQVENDPATKSDDGLEFVTADPVAGTTVTFGYTDGVTNISSDVTEPLGRTVETTDPGSGDPAGGRVVATGTPEDVAAIRKS